VSELLGKQELKVRPDYKPVLKITAQSLFKLGKNDEALKYLSEYQEIDDDDPAISYML